MLKKQKLSHGDIKPENIMFQIADDKKTILPKLIDWPTITDKVDSTIATSDIYYNNPNYWDPETGKIKIKDDEQRYKNEYY